MKSFYEILYKYFRAPWDIGPRKELVSLVTSGRLQPCRAIDLGSGTASNCIYLAENGFDVTGVDYAVSAIDRGRRIADEAGLQVEFIVDDLTNLQHVEGPFDLLIDYGTLDDLVPRNRDLYVESVLPLTRPGSHFLLYTFEWQLRRWERMLMKAAIFGAMAMEPGEVQNRFGKYFEIEEFSRQIDPSKWPPGEVTYLMTRR
jgi:SAM-dependent methyltransferase